MSNDFFSKASENLRASEALSELGLFNAAANRAYYAAFHAAIAVLAKHGIRHDKNPHEWVQAQFSSEIVHRRKLLIRTFHRTLRIFKEYGIQPTTHRLTYQRN
jgi:uncharacterized protein (UPF0332 family)